MNNGGTNNGNMNNDIANEHTTNNYAAHSIFASRSTIKAQRAKFAIEASQANCITKTNPISLARTKRTSRTSNKPVKESTLIIDDIEIRILYMRRRSMALNVKSPDGSVELRVPTRTSRAEIDRFVREKHLWLVKTRDRVLKSPMSRAHFATPEEQQEWSALVQACVPPLIEKWEPILGVKHGKLAYRNMTSRWGSCNTKTGRICINTRLALYPPECLEYVVVHELCHLRVSGHDADFWQLVGSCLPNYKQLRAKLR
jgi:predicted metal-dependent hydrolase